MYMSRTAISYTTTTVSVPGDALRSIEVRTSTANEVSDVRSARARMLLRRPSEGLPGAGVHEGNEGDEDGGLG